MKFGLHLFALYIKIFIHTIIIFVVKKKKKISVLKGLNNFEKYIERIKTMRIMILYNQHLIQKIQKFLFFKKKESKIFL